MPPLLHLVFDSLPGADPEQDPISPALPRVLQQLALRDLTATFVLSEELEAAEPFALAMIENANCTVIRESPADAAARATADDSPAAWHNRLQIAIGDAVRTKDQATIVFDLPALERGDAANHFAETLDLIAGLKRSGSLDR